MLAEEQNKLMLLTNSKVSKRKQKKKRFLMMKEMKKKLKCSKMIKCVRPKMDLESKNGSQEHMKASVVFSLMRMKNPEMKKAWTTMKIATKKDSNKKMKMMNKAITTFESKMTDIYLTYSSREPSIYFKHYS